ncbi:MAG: DMT family transporter [Betaproteobacteria bacterium]
MNAYDFARLFSLAAIWGGSYALMRAVAPVFGGIGTMWLRISIAGVLLLAYATATRQDLQWRTWWKQYLFIGLLNSALPFALIAFAMKTLPAGYGAILNAGSPFFAALCAALMLQERLTAWRIAGMALGLAGVGLIINLGPIPLNTETITAMAASLAATALYGFVIVYTKKYTRGVPNIGIAVGTLVLPALLLAPLGVWSIPSVMPSMQTLLSLLALAALCSAVAYLLYFRLIRDVGPTRAISVTFLIPLFGVAWGAIFFGEALNEGAIIGGVVVLAGVALVLEVLPLPRSISKA